MQPGFPTGYRFLTGIVRPYQTLQLSLGFLHGCSLFLLFLRKAGLLLLQFALLAGQIPVLLLQFRHLSFQCGCFLLQCFPAPHPLFLFLLGGADGIAQIHHLPHIFKIAVR